MIQQAPTANRYIEDAQTERQYKMHVKNVKNMKPSINTHADQKALDKAKQKNPRVRIFDGQNAITPRDNPSQLKKTKSVEKAERRPKTAVVNYNSIDSINDDFDSKNSNTFEDDFEIDIFPVDPKKGSSQKILNEKDDIKPKKKPVHKIPIRSKPSTHSKQTTLEQNKSKDIIRKQPSSSSSLSNNYSTHTEISSQRTEKVAPKKVQPKTDSARRKIKNNDSDANINYPKPKSNVPLANQPPKLLVNKQIDKTKPKQITKKKSATEQTDGSIKKEKKEISKRIAAPDDKQNTKQKVLTTVSNIKDKEDDPNIRKMKSDNNFPCIPIVSEEKPKITFGADMWETDDYDDDDSDIIDIVDDNEDIVEDNDLLKEIDSDNENKKDSIVHDDFVCSDDFSSDNDF